MENSRCIVMRSPSPLVISGQPMPFDANIDTAAINMVPAHHFMHPQLIYPHYLRDSIGPFVPPSKIEYFLKNINSSIFNFHLFIF